MPSQDEAGALLRPWPAPFEAPPFDAVTTADFEPAFNVVFPEHLAEIAAISGCSAAADFDNTIAALERSGRRLNRVASVFGALSGTRSDQPLQQVEQRLAPRFAAHQDAVTLYPGLFERIAAVKSQLDEDPSTPAERHRLVTCYQWQFERRGAKLDAGGKARLMQINQRLATLYTAFTQNILAEEEQQSLTLSAAEDLHGLPDALVAAARAEAERRGLAQGWVIANTRSAVEPFLTFSTRRDLREAAWRMWTRRGDNEGEHDNKPLIAQIVALRTERAKLLGYASHAHYQLADNMARSPQAALQLMQRTWAPALQAAKADLATFQRLLAEAGESFAIEPWDWRYCAERVRQEQYDVDEGLLKPYLSLDNMQSAAFWCAERLYGLRFEACPTVAVYHPDVSVYRVIDGDGQSIGLFYFDPYARAGKHSGAWMSEFRTAEFFDGARIPMVVNVCNFARPAPGAPALLGWDDVVTLFHEFGHALHGLLSKAAYPLLAGTNVPRDFVEFPSQINEHWATHPQVLARFARHWQTGEAMSQDLIDRVLKARRFNQGFAMVEYLASAWVDMDLHLREHTSLDISAFEAESLQRLGMPREIVMRHRPTHFAHVFASDGYSALYYAYLWAQVLDHDGFAAFEESGDIFDAATALRLRREVLERGNSRDPQESYRRFRGREPRIDALLRNRGFAAPGEAQDSRA